MILGHTGHSKIQSRPRAGPDIACESTSAGEVSSERKPPVDRGIPVWSKSRVSFEGRENMGADRVAGGGAALAVR